MTNTINSTEIDSVGTSSKKHEGEMLQLELYVADLDKTCAVFEEVFGLSLIEEKPGWRQLRHPKNFDIMLFSPLPDRIGDGNWSLPARGTGGKGIEIVICTTNVHIKLDSVRKLGYHCTDLNYTPWGSIEFIFHLAEGYLIRVKQPPE